MLADVLPDRPPFLFLDEVVATARLGFVFVSLSA